MKQNTGAKLDLRPPNNEASGLLPWEEKTLLAVGNVIAFWGFKENHGRIWALLSLRKDGLTALEIRRILKLSKGAVSMLLQDLESWTIVVRHEDLLEEHSESKRRGRIYKACSDLYQMIAHVLKHREQDLLNNTVILLKEAHNDALTMGSSSQVNTLNTMLSSALFIQEILQFVCSNPSFAHSFVENAPNLETLKPARERNQ